MRLCGRPPGGQSQCVQVCAALRQRLPERRVHIAEFLPVRDGLRKGSQGRRSADVHTAAEAVGIEGWFEMCAKLLVRYLFPKTSSDGLPRESELDRIKKVIAETNAYFG